MATQVSIQSGAVASAGTLKLQTNGTTDAVHIDASQNVGVGTASPSAKLHVAGSVKATGNTIVEVTDNTNAALRITQLGTGNALLVEDSSNPDSTPFVIDKDGQLIRGYTSALSSLSAGGGSLTPSIQNIANSQAGASFTSQYYSTNTGGGLFSFVRSKSATVGTLATLVDGDDLGSIVFTGVDAAGTPALKTAAYIIAEVDGSPSSTTVPAALNFATAGGTDTSPTLRMRITADGYVGIGTQSPEYAFDLQTEASNNTGDVVARIKSNNTAGAGDAEAALILDSGSLVVSTVTAGSFVVGTRYRIATVGTTDFTLIGAAANTVGVSFVATGVGSGTGTAVTLNSGEAEIQFKTSGYDRAYMGWNEDAGLFSIDASNGGNDGIIRLIADGGTGNVQIYASNNGLTSTSSKNTLRFIDSDTTTALNQPVGVIDFYTSDISTGGTGVVAYMMSAAAGTSGGGDLRFGTAPNASSGSPVERMRIDSSGTLLVGGTTSNSAYRMRVTSGGTTSATYAAVFETSSAGNIFVLRSDGYINSGTLSASPYNYTTATAANACFLSDGSFARSTSALKYKQDVRDLEVIDINKFRAVRYKSKGSADNKTQDYFGVIADEVAEAGVTELVTYGADGEVEGFQYERLTVVLLKALQEQQALITTLTERITALEQ